MKNVLFIMVLLCGMALYSPSYAASKSKVYDYLPLYSEAPYSANVKTMKYHKPDCKFYDCRDCTKYFRSPKEAEHAGYQQCKVCWK